MLDLIFNPLFSALAFIILVMGLGFIIGPLIHYNRTQKRISQIFGDAGHASTGALFENTDRFFDKVIQPLAQLTGGSDGLGTKEIQQACAQAGLREKREIISFNAARAALFLFLPLLFFIYTYIKSGSIGGTGNLFMSLLVAAAGYYMPLQYLRMQRQMRAQAMQNALPDLIDLLVICTESGLALDQAIARSAKELSDTSPILAEEFHLLTLEVRAGAGRARALRNLAERVLLDDMTNFTSMLIQADRFGTSVSEALRIQSDVMRTKRTQRAEEIAAKIPTKILLPVIICIFPVLLIVIIGPAIIQITSAFPK